MARRHGRNSRLYMNLTSGGTAEPVAFISQWSINFAVDYPEVTAVGDTGKVYVAGLPDVSGTISGFYDDSTVQMYTSATDGIARKFYLYTDIVNAPTQYWFGTAFFDTSITGGVSDPLAFSGSLKAASAVAKVG